MLNCSLELQLEENHSILVIYQATAHMHIYLHYKLHKSTSVFAPKRSQAAIRKLPKSSCKPN